MESLRQMETRWLILILLFFTRISLGFQFQTMGSISSEVITELGLNYTQIGSLIGLFMIPGLFLAVPAGFAGKLMSDKFIIGSGLVFLGLGGSVAGLAGSFDMLAAGRFICGIGFVVSTIFFAKAATDWFEGKELATAMGVLVMSWPFGIAMGQFSHGWLAAHLDWRMAFWIASLYCLISALLLVIFYTPPKTNPNTIKKNASKIGKNEIILTLIASLAWSFFNAGYVVYLSFAPSILISNGHSTVSALGIISIASWVMIFSGTLCGYITDRTKKPHTVLIICLTISVIALLILLYTPMAVVSSLLFGLIGMAPAGVIISLTAQSMKPKNRAIGMGLFFMGQFIFQGPSPAVAGWIYDQTLNEILPIFFAISLFVAAGIATLVFRMAQKRLPI